MKQWLAHPRHEEVKRDIGESSFRESDYKADLDGYVDYSSEVDDTLPEGPTTSDEEWLAPSDEEPEVDDKVKDKLDELDEAAGGMAKKN